MAVVPRRPSLYIILFAVVVLVEGSTSQTQVSASHQQQLHHGQRKDLETFYDPTKSIDERANALLANMTIEEKVAELQAWPRIHAAPQKCTSGSLKCALEALTQINNEQQRRITAGNIPEAYAFEALHSGSAWGTIFPELLTQGTAWSTDLVQNISQVIAQELRAMGGAVGWSPVLNMWSDPRNGRHQEGYTPNPTLTSHYAVAAVKGLQGQVMANASYQYLCTDPSDCSKRIVSLAKHYAAYGAAMGGLNGASAEADERMIRDWYLKPWAAFAKAGGRGCMTSHNTINDVPMHANQYLVDQVLRNEFGFGDGIIVSDAGDVTNLQYYRTAANMSMAAAQSLNANCVDKDLGPAYSSVPDALKDGFVTMETVDRSVRRSLKTKLAARVIDNPITDPSGVAELNNPERQALARKAAQMGIVMTINRNNTLPLDSKEFGSGGTKTISVVGPLGSGLLTKNTKPAYLGSYQSSFEDHYAPSIHLALAERFTPNTTFKYIGCFQDQTKDRDLPVFPWGPLTSEMTAQFCSSLCVGYKYFGLQYGHQCFCGNTFGKHGEAPSCNSTCEGNWREPCGANEANSVFQNLRSGVNISFAPGSGDPSNERMWDDHSLEDAAVEVAQQSDVTIVAVGEDLGTCGEWHDRDNIDLIGTQLSLLEKIVATNTTVIVALITGRSQTFGPYASDRSHLLDKVAGMFVLGRPGEQGGHAFVDLLFGDVTPSGKLASSWPRSVGAVGSGSSPWLQSIRGKWIANSRSPLDPDGRAYDPYVSNIPADPLFEFGWGLSYTNFTYSNLSVTLSSNSSFPFVANVIVTNSGSISGEEVVQVYLVDPPSWQWGQVMTRMWKRLAGFQRTSLLSPGQTVNIEVPILYEDIAFHDVDLVYGVKPGNYTVRVGTSSRRDYLATSIILPSEVADVFNTKQLSGKLRGVSKHQHEIAKLQSEIMQLKSKLSEE